MRRSTDAALRSLKRRVRDNAFRYTDAAFPRMVDAFLYEEDVKRGVATGRLATEAVDPLGRTLFILQGWSMNEDPIGIVCRLVRTRVEVVDVFRLAESQDRMEP